MNISESLLLLAAIVQSLSFSTCKALDFSNGFNSKLDWNPPELLLVSTMLRSLFTLDCQIALCNYFVREDPRCCLVVMHQLHRANLDMSHLCLHP